MDFRALVFNSGTYERADLSKKTEKELYELWRQDEKSGMAQVQCLTLGELSEAFNDEELSDQDWLYFVDVDDVGGEDAPDLSELNGTLRRGILYVREQLCEEDVTIIRAQVSKNLRQHQSPARGTDEGKVIDLLEEYGEENGYPEGWWVDECEIDDIMVLL